MKEACGTCGSMEWLRLRVRYFEGERFEGCDRCDGRGLGTDVAVDGAGQPIYFPTGGFYSVAAGDRWWNTKREFVNYLKENNLVQNIGKAMGRKNHDGTRNAPAKR